MGKDSRNKPAAGICQRAIGCLVEIVAGGPAFCLETSVG